MSTRIITGKVRFSYANVWTPKAIVEGGPEKYSVSLLIPKKDKVTLNKIKNAVEEAKEAGKANKWGGKIPPNLKTPIRDGDIDRIDNPEYKNCYFINANSNNKPEIVDSNVEEIINQAEFYSGCYGKAAITFYPFNTNGNKGVACGLGNLQKLEEGERLDGGVSATQDFSAEDDDIM